MKLISIQKLSLLVLLAVIVLGIVGCERLEETYSVAGIVETDGGIPIEGVSITVGDTIVTSNEDGQWGPVIELSGSVTITAELEGWYFESVEVNQEDKNIVIIGIDEAEVYSVAGVVKTVYGEEPLAGVSIMVGDKEVTTDTDGQWGPVTGLFGTVSIVAELGDWSFGAPLEVSEETENIVIKGIETTNYLGRFFDNQQGTVGENAGGWYGDVDGTKIVYTTDPEDEENIVEKLIIRKDIAFGAPYKLLQWGGEAEGEYYVEEYKIRFEGRIISTVGGRRIEAGGFIKLADKLTEGETIQYLAGTNIGNEGDILIPLANDQWHHIMLVVNNITLKEKLYLNGVKVMESYTDEIQPFRGNEVRRPRPHHPELPEDALEDETAAIYLNNMAAYVVDGQTMKAVLKAQETGTQEDIDTAADLINKLPESTARTALIARIIAIAGID